MFRYRLETLLKFRKTVEDQGKRSLAEANRRYLDQVAVVESLKSKKAEIMKLIGDLAARNPDARIMKIYDSYLDGYEVDIKEEASKAEQAKTIMEMERQKLIDARKKRLIIEHHKGLLKERYDAEEARKERIQADEMAIMRFSGRGAL